MRTLKEKKSSNIILSGFTCITLILVIMVVILIQELEEAHTRYSASLLNGVTYNIAQMSNQYFSKAREQVEIAATSIGLSPHLNPHAALKDIALILAKDFLFIGLITPDQKIYTLDGFGDEVEISPILAQELVENQAKSVCSIAEFASRGPAIMLSAPVKHNQQHLGTLFIVRGHLQLLTMFNSISFEHKFNFFIFDSEGRVISTSDKAVLHKPSILIRLRKFYSEYKASPHIIPQNPATENRVINIALAQEDFYANIVNIPNMNWTLGVLLPTRAVQSYTNYIIYTISITLGVWLFCFVGLMILLIHTQRRAHASTHARAQELQKIVNTIPCAIVRCLNDENWTIIDYSDSLNELLEASPDDIKNIYNNSWRELIHPEDRLSVQQAMGNTELEIRTLEYRILRKNNDTIYVMDRARAVDDERGSYLWCVVVNIDDLKNSQAQERNMVERYKYLLEISESILYEYDLANHKLCVSMQFFKQFDYPMPDSTVQFHYPIGRDIVHPEDMDLFMSMQMRIKVGGKTAAALLRIKTYQGQWLWCQLRQAAWIDASGKLKAIGKIENVDQQTRILHQLREDVQRDSFTQLYNKTATAELIQRELEQESESRGAFCIIDIDNFKQINSHFGHAMGDMVIKNLAEGLSHIFRSDDIIGRIGGDEFIVYIKDMPNLRPLLQKIDHIQEFFRQTYEDGDVKVSISSSVGIALYPKDGTSYGELYRNADKALYHSKMKKNTYSFFEHEADI